MTTLATQPTQSLFDNDSDSDSDSEVVDLKIRLKDPECFTSGAWKKKEEHVFTGIDKDGNEIPMECANGKKWGAAGLKKCPKFRASVKGGDSSKKGEISSHRKAQEYYNALEQKVKHKVKKHFKDGGTGSHGTITKKDMKDYIEGKKKKKKNKEKDLFNKGALKLIEESGFKKHELVKIMNLKKDGVLLIPRRELKKSHYGEPEVRQAILCLEVSEALKSKQ